MSKIKKWFDKTNKFDLIGYIVLFVFMACILSYLSINIEYITDSDQSSNLIYAKELIKNKTLLPTTWYFSTYVDIFNIDKIQALLFLFLDDWMLVHVFSNIMVEVIYFISFIYACKVSNVKHISWLALLALCGLSYQQYKFVLSFNIYAWYMTLSFVSYGLLVDILKNNSRFKEVMYILVVFMVSSSGIRNIATIFVPVIATIVVLLFLEKVHYYEKSIYTKKYKKIALIIALGSITGYLFNSLVLCKITGYVPTPLALTREIIKEFPTILYNLIINGWLHLCGINSIGIISLLCVILLIVVIVYCFKVLISKDTEAFFDKFLVIFFIMSACVISATFFVSVSFPFATRYLLQAYGFLIIILGSLLSKMSIKKTMCIYVALAVCVMIRGTNYALQEVRSSINQELLDMVEILDEKNVTNGYAGFWNGNIIKELSNGEIEIWTYSNEKSLFSMNYEGKRKDLHIDKEHLFLWLQLKEHADTKPSEPFFLIMDNYYCEYFNEKAIEKYSIYKGKRRVLMIFDDYLDFSDIFNLSLEG